MDIFNYIFTPSSKKEETKLTKNMMNYIPCVPPKETKPFIEMNKKEAVAYYNWFVSKIDERSNYLREKVSEGMNIPIEQLDFSLESLIPIWRWYLTVQELESLPKEAIEEKIAFFKSYNTPQHAIDHWIETQSMRLSVFSEFVLRDIGMYLTKMLLDKYSCLELNIRRKPKSIIFVNEPIIIGFVDDNPSYPKPFYQDVEPINLARVPALNLLRKMPQTDKDLYNWVMKMCIPFIPKDQTRSWIPEEEKKRKGCCF